MIATAEHRSRAIMVGVAVASLALFVYVAVASAGKSPQGVIGAQGGTGGLFQNPSDVAVRHSTGQIYVADAGNNRVQRLDSDGDFEVAFGRDVIETGAGGDLGDVLEVCTNAPDCKPGATGEPAIGGQLDDPQKLTINQSTGDVYVLANQRISQFDADGNFVRLWGGGVVQSGGVGDVPTNEEKTISFSRVVNGGGFKLTVEGQTTNFPGTGDLTTLATGTGDVTKGSTTVTNLNTTSGAFAVGESISGTTIPPQTTIAAVGAGTLTLSNPGASTASATALASGSKTITNFTTAGGVFLGMRLSGPGIGPDTTITAVDLGAGTLTLSHGVTAAGTGVPLTADLPFDASAAMVQAALEALSNVAPGDVAVATPADAAPNWTVAFSGAYAQLPVAMSGAGSGLCWSFGCGFRVPVETTMAAGGFEICTVANQCRVGTSDGTGAGQIAAPASTGPGDLAVGPTGHVFLADTRNARVQEFEGDGDFVRAWGRGVDTDQGWGLNIDANKFEICTAASRCQAGRGPDVAAGGLGFVLKPYKNGQFANGDISGESYTEGRDPRAIAVDAAGIVYASSGDLPQGSAQQSEIRTTRIDRFDSTKSTAGELLLPNPIRAEDAPNPNTPGPLPGPSTQGPFAAALEIDPSTGNLYFLTAGDSGAGVGDSSSFGIFEIDPDPHPGTRVDVHMAGYGARGLGYADGSDRLYASTTSGGHRLIVVDDPPPADPAVSIEPVQIEGETGARFSGEVTPGGPPGLSTSYRFEYKRSSDSEWTALPPQMIDIGDGNLPVEVSQDLNERQVVNLPGATTGGTFTLSFDGDESAAIAFDADAASVEAALEALPAIGVGNVEVTGVAGGPWTVAFLSSLSGTDVSLLQADGSGLNPPGSPSVSTARQGVTLQFGATYEARLLAVREFGAGSTTSAIVQFKVGDQPPVVETLSPQRLTDVGATLSGRVNPQNLETTYYFEYGTDTGYGLTAPIPPAIFPAGAADTPQPVAVDITGLEPSTTYHYRLVADNGEEEGPGDTVVEGADVEFTTRATIDAVEPDRRFEMVTPPFKVVRGAVASGGRPGLNANTALPSLDGEALHWTSPFFPLTDDVGAPLSGDQRLLRRVPNLGWVEQTLNTLGLIPGQNPLFVALAGVASSGDLLTVPLHTQSGSVDPPTGGLLPTEGTNPNRLYTRRLGTGTEGYTPWLTNPDEQYTGLPDPGDANGGMADYAVPREGALVNDDGTAMVRWGDFFGLAEDPNTPGDDDPTDELPLDEVATIYLQRAVDPDDLPAAPKDLVNECTGAGGSSTQIPSRVGSGASTDTIGSQDCEEGELPNLDGAEVGANTSLSNDGSRVFFHTPRDDLAGPTSCAAGTGPETSCPPQLYVRQYGSDGETAMVRWVSRSRSTALGEDRFGGPMIAGQQIAEMGAGATFQGGSRKGDVVYFQTNAPLVPTDPNGGDSITAGAASGNSWDLYRYELPASLDEDPGEGALTRISGGPGGGADPSTNPSNGSGSSLQFLSGDGRRAYFLTTSPIAGADATSPAEGATTPGGTVGNASVRNLYLFDDNEAGADRYTFVGRIEAGSSICGQGYQYSAAGLGSTAKAADNCFRGTPDGSHLVISTTSQLTGDDSDTAVDVYLYDAAADSLSRLSMPPAGAVSYLCNDESGMRCNADLGWTPFGGGFGGSPSGQSNTARGFGGMRYMNISKDGSGEVSVFFESRAELLPADSNGDHWDVYEWREGELFLVSRALPGHHSWFSGNSLSGDDAFIWTSDRIDPRELDDFDYDLYDARIGGGFPFTPPPEPCDVLALKCESGAVPVPTVRPPDSAGFSGRGNVPPPKKCRKGKVRRKGRCVKPRKAKHRKATRHAKQGAKGGSK